MLMIVNRVLWAVATALIFCFGIFFTWRFRFVQFRISKIVSSLKRRKSSADGISPISSLMMVLAGRIGVGSIAGVALAIHIGTIKMMWQYFQDVLMRKVKRNMILYMI